MKKIRLYNTPKGWFACFINDKDILDLFGTDTLATGFTESALPMDVLKAIKKLNPRHEVYFNV